MSAIRTLALQSRMLRALLDAPNGQATICDATDDLAAEFGDGGKWRGPAMLELAKAGFMRRIGAANSKRRRRHAGLVGVWQLVTDDHSHVRAAIHYLERCLQKSSTVAAAEPKQLHLPHFDEGTESNGQA